MRVTVIIPIYKGESTIEQTFNSLLLQSKKFSELIILIDGSPDNSEEIISDFIKRNKVKNCRLKIHKKPLGLSATYNEGIRLAKSDFIVTLHQDVILFKKSLELLCSPFEKDDPKIVASTHIVLHPIKIWQKYNFWQKVFFSRLVNKKFSGIDGKFDCFRKDTLLKVGLFDQKNFRTAGEDGDIVYKLKQIGKIVETKAEIIHIHQASGKFSLGDIITKQAQYSEAQGALLRRGRVRGMMQFVKTFFREILFLALFIPYIKFLALIVIVIYSFSYTTKVFASQWRDARIIILPFVNIFLLFVSFLFSIKGFLQGRQMI